MKPVSISTLFRLARPPRPRLSPVEVVSLIPTLWWAFIATTSNSGFHRASQWRVLLDVMGVTAIGWWCLFLAGMKVAALLQVLPRRIARLPFGLAAAWWTFCLCCLVLGKWDSTTAGFVAEGGMLNLWAYLRADE